MKSRVGFFVESYGNRSRANGICTKKIIDELKKNDLEIFVFSTKTHLSDVSQQELEKVKVFKLFRDISHLFREKSNINTGMKKNLYHLLYKSFGLLTYPINYFFWPLKSPFLIQKYYKLSSKTNKEKNFHAIVGVYLYLEEVLAAIKLKKKNPNLKLFIYTLDALSGKETPKNNFFAKRSIKKWENYIFKHADKIFVMKSHMSHYNQEKYITVKSKFIYVDIPLFVTRPNLKNELYTLSNKINVIYTGSSTFYSGDPGYFISLMKHVKEINLHMYGVVDDYVKKQIENSELFQKRIFFHGKLDNSQIYKIQEDADFLITFGSKNGNMIPSKIFEYFSSNKPIINIYKIEEDAAYNYIAKYPDKLQLLEEHDKISQNAKLLKEFLVNENRPYIDDSVLREIFEENTPNKMVSEILRIIGDMN